MKILIHVGLQKTASTFLQTIFAASESIGYVGRPYTQENHAFNKLQYADDSLFDENELRAELDKLLHAYRDRQAIVISDEMFSGFPFFNFINRAAIADRLVHLLPDAEVILYLRNQFDLIRSLHNYYVKIGWLSHGLDARFITAPGNGFKLPAWAAGERHWNRRQRFIDHRSVCSVEHFRYSKLLSFYHARFETVHVQLYEDLQQDTITQLAHLGSLIGVPELGDGLTSPAKRVNSSLGAQPLVDQLVSNQLAGIPLELAKRLLRPMLVRSQRDTMVAGDAYLRDILSQSDLAADNCLVDERYDLGFARHAGYRLA